VRSDDPSLQGGTKIYDCLDGSLYRGSHGLLLAAKLGQRMTTRSFVASQLSFKAV